MPAVVLDGADRQNHDWLRLDQLAHFGPRVVLIQVGLSLHAVYNSSDANLLDPNQQPDRGSPRERADRSAAQDRSTQPIQILLHEIAAHFCDVSVDKALRDRTRRAAAADTGAVKAAHRGDAEARRG